MSTPDHPELPSGWNTSQGVYSLQYRHQQTQNLCLVKAIPMGVQLLISVVVGILWEFWLAVYDILCVIRQLVRWRRCCL